MSIAVFDKIPFATYFFTNFILRQKEEAADLFHMKKERRQHSLNRTYYSDYIGLDDAPGKLLTHNISKRLTKITKF